MTLKAIVEQCAKEVEEVEHLVNVDGVLPEKYCGWYLSARTQRISEINQGLGLAGTSGFQNKGCYDKCTLENPNCEAYKR